jgi:hypothetical protein
VITVFEVIPKQLDSASRYGVVVRSVSSDDAWLVGSDFIVKISGTVDLVETHGLFISDPIVSIEDNSLRVIASENYDRLITQVELYDAPIFQKGE